MPPDPPPIPLETYTFCNRLGNQSAFILDPCLLSVSEVNHHTNLCFFM